MSHQVTRNRARSKRRACTRIGLAVAAGGLLLMTGAPAAASARAYELVSPPDKGNGGVILGLRASDDGNAVAYYLNSPTRSSDAAYVTVPFVSYRSAEGWTARSAGPPIRAEQRAAGEIRGIFRDASVDFRSVYLQTNDAIDPEDPEPMADGHPGYGWDVYRFDPLTRHAEWLSRPNADVAADYGAGGRSGLLADYVGSSADGSHVVFMTNRAAVQGVTPLVTNVYESVGGETRLAGILPDGTVPLGGTTPPTGTSLPYTNWKRNGNTISDDGSRIVFRSGGLYLREGGVQTLAISASQRTGSVGAVATATFMGMTSDAEVVYFQSASALTDDAPASGGGLYRWDRRGEQLRFLFGPMSQALLLAASRVYQPYLSDDGDRLYFYSGQRLTPDAATGQRNLYLWDGAIRLVANTPTAAPQYDPRLRVSPDGAVALFSSRRPIDASFNHRSGVSEIYRYDATTETISCVSCRTDGVPSENEALFRPTDAKYSTAINTQASQARNMTADGNTVFFQTAEPLVHHDTNGAFDVYAWQNGQHTLVSLGRGESSEIIDNSDDGRTVFFMTSESLLPQDIDGGYPDAYAARIDGGFPLPPEPPEACQGDNCQGPLVNPPLFGSPGSALATPDTDDGEPQGRAVTFSIVKTNAAQRRAYARTGRIALRVRTNTPGSIMVAARARLGRRRLPVGRGWQRTARRRTVRVTISLNARAKRWLAQGRALRVTLTVQHSASEATKRASLRLRRSNRNERRARKPVLRRKAAVR